MIDTAINSCRLCNFSSVRSLGACEYFEGFPVDVFHCDNCGCRFTPHNSLVHEKFHKTGATNYYFQYRDLASTCEKFFRIGDRTGLAGYLRNHSSKYKFVIEHLQRLPDRSRVLEVGCSRGYLTSLPILLGHETIGVDTSAEAISAAIEMFGEHFFLPDDDATKHYAPYDLIYHVGVIGCTEDPLHLTKSLLRMLKTGGKLVFNCPVLEACYLRDQLWLDSAPPPDLTTLFPIGFWSRNITGVNRVREVVEHVGERESFRRLMRGKLGRKWVNPPKRNLVDVDAAPTPFCQRNSPIYSLFESSITSLLGSLNCLNLFSTPQPFDFGLFVEITS